MLRRRSALAVLALGWIALSGSAGTGAPGEPSPLAGLPPWMRLLLPWGQRPEWDRGGRHLLFMEKAFGDAYRLDVETGAVTPLTTHFFHDGFDRVLALPNGDYLLTGTRDFEARDPWRTRHRLEMFVLDKGLAKPAVPLGEWCDEGPAVSRTRMHVAWTAPGQRDMYEADLVYTADGTPSLSGKRLVLSYADRPMTERLETQDFRPPDEKELLFSCYSGTVEEPFYFSDVCGIDLAERPDPQLHGYPGAVRRAGERLPRRPAHAGRERPPRRQPQVEDRHLPAGPRRQQSGGPDDVLRRVRRAVPRQQPGGEPGRPLRRRAARNPRHGRGPGRGLVLVDLVAWEKTLGR